MIAAYERLLQKGVLKDGMTIKDNLQQIASDP